MKCKKIKITIRGYEEVYKLRFGTFIKLVHLIECPSDFDFACCINIALLFLLVVSLLFNLYSPYSPGVERRHR